MSLLAFIAPDSPTLGLAWIATHSPGANVQATATRAAGGQGVRHCCTGFGIEISNSAAPPGPIGCVLRDGLTGVGAVIINLGTMVAPASTPDRLWVTGLSIWGSPNTAMTVEFLAVPGAGNFQKVAIFGFDR